MASSPVMETFTASADPDDDIEYDFFPYLLLYKSGRVERIVEGLHVPCGVDPHTGVDSKDVLIDPVTGVSARIFLPSCADDHEKKKLPILVYFHGGGFVVLSPFSTPYHQQVSSIAACANVLAVSVDYRLAPEYPLPAAYDDSLEALRWVVSHADGGGQEPWLAEHGDFSRIFLAGDSAGGNIAHNILQRAGGDNAGWLPEGAKIEGLVLVHPYFWGKEPVGEETRESWIRERIESAWGFQSGWKMGVEDARIDPLTSLTTGALPPCERVLVLVAGSDLFGERGRAYYEELLAAAAAGRWHGEAEVYETEGGGHVFHILNPDSGEAVALMECIAAFLNSKWSSSDVS